ncbi:hypothetical protein ACHAXS_001840 [Conticribra weissflogii]
MTAVAVRLRRRPPSSSSSLPTTSTALSYRDPDQSDDNGNNNSMSSSTLYTILHYLRLCLHSLANLFRGTTGGDDDDFDDDDRGLSLLSFLFRPTKHRRRLITFDNGMQVHMGKQIAEGGFSYVFEAFGPTDPAAAAANAKVVAAMTMTSHHRHHHGRHRGNETMAKYALKRINCPDHELIQACRHEAGIHRSLPADHPNLLTLLGLKFDNAVDSPSPSSEYNVCYMLFPYLPHSLRGEITERRLLWDGDRRARGKHARRRPFSTNDVLRLLGGIVDALSAMHELGISHRDVKLENVLLDDCRRPLRDDRDDDPTAATVAPVLMDFGSAGPLVVPIPTRSAVLTVVEHAARNTTAPYRPPELFEGGLRHGEEETLDCGRVDAWSLGCVLFGMMHGSSPFEVEFVRGTGEEEEGVAKIVECTHLKILGEVPFPPWARGGNVDEKESDGFDGRDGRYPLKLYRFVRYMTNQDRLARPDMRAVAKRLEELYVDLLGERWVRYESGRGARSGSGMTDGSDDVGSDAAFDSLLRSRDFV